jgi:hypothetical protein
VNVKEKHALWVKQCEHLDKLNADGGGEDMDHFRDCNDDHDALSHVLAEALGPVLVEVEQLRLELGEAKSVLKMQDKEIEQQRKEIDKLKAEVAWQEERNAMNVKVYQDKLDAALAIPDRERLKNGSLKTDYAEVVALTVKALNGGEK